MLGMYSSVVHVKIGIHNSVCMHLRHHGNVCLHGNIHILCVTMVVFLFELTYIPAVDATIKVTALVSDYNLCMSKS